MDENESLDAAAERLPSLLRSVADADSDLPSSEALEAPIISTGVGLSGGPARLFAERCTHLGRAARFLALSELAGGPSRADHPVSTLVVFSQSLSPNATLANRLSPTRTVVFTGLDPDQDPRLRRLLGPSGRVVHVPASERHGHMVRLHSPVTAAYAALRWLARTDPRPPWAVHLDAVPQRSAEALDRSRQHATTDTVQALLERPLVFVTAGQNPAELHHLAFKWAETVFMGPPPIYDALELAHGPFQAFYDQEMVLLGLETPGMEDVFRRVRAALAPDRHRYYPLSACLPPPLSIFEHDAAVNALLGAMLAAHGPPRQWPGRGRDAPLYEVCG